MLTSASGADGAAPSDSPLTLAQGDQPEIDLEIKRSHFLARAARADCEEEARAFIAAVRGDHPDARHHCSAYTVPSPGALPIERSNDDGEPSGTAGQPMLETLRGTRLANTTVVVARYFGGTLLGTGGLVRAYSEATARALARASRVELIRRHLWDLRVPVAQAGRIEAELRSRDVTGGDHDGHRSIQVEETIWGPTHAVLILATPFADPALLREPLAALTRGEGIAEPAGSRLVEVPLPSSA